MLVGTEPSDLCSVGVVEATFDLTVQLLSQ